MQRAVWRQPWQRRRGSAVSLLVLALMLLPPTVFGVAKGLGAGTFVGIAGLLASVWWWWITVEGLIGQNHPDLARLVPGQLQALRRQLLGQAAAVFAAAFGFVVLLRGPGLDMAWTVALVILLLAWLVAEPWGWLPVSLLPVTSVMSSLRVWTWPSAMAAWPLAAQALAAVLLVLALPAVLGGGSARHRRAYGRIRLWARVQRGEDTSSAAVAQTPWLRVLGAFFSWPQALYRRWLLAHASPANALQRLDLGLQAGGLWPMALWLCVLCAAFLALLTLALPGGLTGPAAMNAVHAARFGLCVGAFSLAMAPLAGRAATLWRRRREQALLVLLPGLPQGAALAAALEAKWRREFLATWLPLGLLMLLLAGSGGEGTLRYAAACMALYLPVQWLVQHWHRHLKQGVQSTGSVRWMLLHAAIAAGAGLAEWLGVPPGASLAAGAAAYALLAWRSARPVQPWLPVGR